MKPDVPVAHSQFFAAAERHGLNVIPNVSPQRLTVASLEAAGPILRFFSPDLRVLPDGTQINGSIGVALASGNADTRERYAEVLFHHILNLPTMRDADRLVRQEYDFPDFFRILRAELEALPATPGAVADALGDSTSWMGEQLSWGEPRALSFQQKVYELAGG